MPFASPVVPLVKVIRHGSVGARARRPAPGSAAKSDSSGIVRTVARRAARSTARRRCARRRRSASAAAAAIRSAQVLGPQLLVAGQHDGADPEARDHRQHPLGPVADQRHHDVAAARRRGARSVPASRALRSATSPKRPLAPARRRGPARPAPAVRRARRRRRRGRSSSRRPVCQDRAPVTFWNGVLWLHLLAMAFFVGGAADAGGGRGAGAARAPRIAGRCARPRGGSGSGRVIAVGVLIVTGVDDGQPPAPLERLDAAGEARALVVLRRPADRAHTCAGPTWHALDAAIFAVSLAIVWLGIVVAG